MSTVTEIDERRSHWVVTALGATVEWDAEISEEVDGSRIGWRSTADASVPNEGAVTPAPGGRGTEVRAAQSAPGCGPAPG